MNKLTVTMTKREALWGYIYLLFQLTLLPVGIVFVNLQLKQPLSDAKINFLLFCINFLCVTVIFHRFLIQNTKTALSNIWRCLQSAVFGFGLYWVLTFAVVLLIQALYPSFYNVNDDSVSQLLAENPGLIQFATVLLVPITEELLYRGLIFRGIYRKNPIAAYVISIILFAALHVVPYITMYEPLHLVLCFLQYLPASFCLAWAYVRADSIWAPILIHIAVNQIGTASMR